MTPDPHRNGKPSRIGNVTPPQSLQHEPLATRISDRIKTWHVILAAAVTLIGFGAWAHAKQSSFATKGELQAVATTEQKHDTDIATIKQAVTDTRSDMDSMLRRQEAQTKMIVDILNTVRDRRR